MIVSTLHKLRQMAVGYEEIRSDSAPERQEQSVRMVQRSESQAAEYFFTVPCDARLRVLGVVVRNRPVRVAYEELHSCAQTSRQAQLDVSAFHQLTQDFSLSMLATRAAELFFPVTAAAAGAQAILSLLMPELLTYLHLRLGYLSADKAGDEKKRMSLGAAAC